MLAVCVYRLPLKTLSHEHTVERDRDANWRQGHTKQSFPKEPEGLRAIFIPKAQEPQVTPGLKPPRKGTNSVLHLSTLSSMKV